MAGQNDKVIELQQRLQALSALTARAALAAKLGMSYGGDRNLYQALGYKTDLDYGDFAARYKRQEIANAVVNRPIKATWRGDLLLLESDDDKTTPLEQDWLDLEDRLAVKSTLQRLDKLSSIGRYGVLLFGLDDVSDKADFAQPVSSGKRYLHYLKPFAEGSAKISKFVQDPNNERYGLSEFYTITLGGAEGFAQTITVHYTRVLHVAGELLESDVYGVPVLEPVFNRLEDLEKITGGSGEMFWRGARPGYQGNVDPDFQMTPEQEASLQEKIDEYEHNLRRIIMAQGVEYKALASQVESPTDYIDAQIQMISAQTGIPKRILVGSERGELASSQDKESWLDYIDGRRSEEVEPGIVRPFVDRCIDFGIIRPAKESYSVQWPDLYEMTAKDRAELGKSRAESISKYGSSSASQDIMPPEMFYKFVLGMDDDEIEVLKEMREQMIRDEEEDFEGEEEEFDQPNPSGRPQANYDPNQPRAKDGKWTTMNPGSGASFDKESKQWLSPDGKPLSEADQERLRSVGMPPGYTDVRVNPDPNGATVAVGRDSKGRLQSKRNPTATDAASVEKYKRVSKLNKNINKIHDGNEADMNNPKLKTQQRDSAAATLLMTETGMRPGSLKDTKADFKSYGATTLEGRHIKSIKGDVVTFEFVGGKSHGKAQVQTATNKSLANYLKSKKVGPNDRVFNVTTKSVNDSFKKHGGEGFKLKDVRTWKGTSTAATMVKKMPAPKNKTEYKKAVKQVATTVSARLGNTPNVALKNYIDPHVFSAWSTAKIGR